MIASHDVLDHYGTTSLLRRIDEALRRARLSDGIIGWADLAPLDQFHIRGSGAGGREPTPPGDFDAAERLRLGGPCSP